MKKVLLFALVALLAASCSRGLYNPNALNNYGTQTQVVLSQANFRIVKHVEFVTEVNSSKLKRQDVEKSAYAELLRKSNLTGSQALINVSIEEVRRENGMMFFPRTNQYVAARGTVIEFLTEKGDAIQSKVTTDTNIQTENTQTN